MKRLAAVLAAALAASQAAAEPGDGFDVEQYRVRLTPDFAAGALRGETEIRLRVTVDRLQELAFTPNRLAIGRATVDGRGVRVEQRPDALVLIPEQPLRRGARITLTLTYSGAPIEGVSFGPASVHSNWFACAWMVCALDRPGDKAMIDLSLVVPAGLTTVGPGRLVSRRAGPAGLEVHRWRSERPYSAFLYSFAAGRYAQAEAREAGVGLRYLSETAPPERLARLFAPTPAMLRFLSSRAGVRFPHRTYSQLHLAGSAAQETISFSLIGDDSIAPILDTPEEDWVIVHELAHQYWGNLVTCADWRQFWLNEGIATFMVAAWKEQRWGRPAYDREMAIARRRHERAVAAGLDVPLTWSGNYPSLTLRRAITYSKAALFLDALRTEIGDRAFWAGLRRFTRRHAGGVVESRDFQHAYEEAAGRDLSPIFSHWVYGTAAND